MIQRTQENRAFVRRVVGRLRKVYRPSEVILFGSYASGRPTSDSDIDVLIVKNTAKPFQRWLFEVRRVVSPVLHGRPFDPIVLTPSELEHRLARGDQFVQGIVANGISVCPREG